MLHTRGLRPPSLAFYPQFLLPVLSHHVVVDSKGRRQAELLLQTDAQDITTLLRYGYGTCAHMMAPDLLVLWSLGSYFLLICLSPFLSFSSSRFVSFSVPSFTATAGASVKSREDDASSGRSVALGVMDGSGADSRQVGVGGQVRSAEDSSQSEQWNSEFHGISGTARSPTCDSQEASQSASQLCASPRTGIPSLSPRSEIPFRSFPGVSSTQDTGSLADSQLLYYTLVRDVSSSSSPS